MLGSDFNHPIKVGVLPPNLLYLNVGSTFNFSIEIDVLPPKLVKLVFGFRFNSVIARNALPSSIESIHFDSDYNQPMENIGLPKSLRKLRFGWEYNSAIPPNMLPHSLTKLKFGYQYNQPLVPGSLPPSLRRLMFGARFNQPMVAGTLPSSLTELIVDGNITNLGNDQGVLPPGIRCLRLAMNFNQQLTLPPKLTDLTFGYQFDRPIHIDALPPTLVNLTFGSDFNQPLVPGSLPSSLRSITFNAHYSHVLAPGTMPTSLTSITIELSHFNCYVDLFPSIPSAARVCLVSHSYDFEKLSQLGKLYRHPDVLNYVVKGVTHDISLRILDEKYTLVLRPDLVGGLRSTDIVFKTSTGSNSNRSSKSDTNSDGDVEASEVEKITTLFNDLSSVVKKNRIVDRDGFKRFHFLTGPLGDRLFNLFDIKKTGMMTLEEFQMSLAVCGKGTEKEKALLIFKFLDIDDDEIITKEELSVLSLVTLESNSPKMPAPRPAAAEETQADNPIVASLVEMGFTRAKAHQAIKATENGTKGQGSSPMEVITSWILQNESSPDIGTTPDVQQQQQQVSPRQVVSVKPDQKTMDELTAGLAVSTILGTFEALFDTIDKDKTGKIKLTQYKKWSQASKKPQELDTLIKPITGLFVRALTWKQQGGDLASISSSSDSISEKTEEKTTAQPPETSAKDLKRFSSVSSIDTSKTRTPPPPPKKEASLAKLDKKAEPAPVSPREDPKANKLATSGEHDSFSDFSDSDDEVIKPAIQVVIREKPIEPITKEPSLVDFTPDIIKPERAQTLRIRGSRPSSSRASLTGAFGTLHPSSQAQQLYAAITPTTTSATAASTSSTSSTSAPPAAHPAVLATQTSASTTANNTPDYISDSSSTISTANAGTPFKTMPAGLESMKLCVKYLEQGDFAESRTHLDQCIQQININRIRNDIIFCVGYRVALALLEEIQLLDQQYKASDNEQERTTLITRLGILSRYLVGLPLQSQHRIVCANMAVRYNLEARNYGIASKTIDLLLQQQQHIVSSEDRTRLEAQQATCQENHNTNHSLPIYSCPACKATSSPIADDRVLPSACSCNQPYRFCFSKFEPIKEQDHLACDYCHSITTTSNKASPCTMCTIGQVDIRS
ncbi:hypothetical protein SAMD00019534_098650 [Acytostelium subglobosum LB1]|uniref:hypothetical protein n=1 Tax=Acytostelium subglobosum LB1 TaxID=1410327 RepID=UPI000644B432|nr:hypothetical protein SAMD00019534_098650 [Acytostelium subglobosum LB1]GAM26690.1 hypothetical protein SAMD00019534_098650 [Acytostelium subglobosum LB1]|eukprot:XP_012750351.1 hypothetical protein SAMD00019534_098650 [Acytostelium subglobosum LB1]